MDMNVFDLAQEDTSLKKKSHNEYAGPCPRCGGFDRFVVHLTKKAHGAWMCRGCWDPQVNGWGDDIQYLREMRGMSFTAAKKLLARETNTLLERVSNLKTYVEPTAPGRVEPPNEKWQKRTAKEVEQAIARLSLKAGRASLEYLRSRGLTDATIRSAQLGYAEIEDQDAGERIPYIVIPWHAEKGYWCIKLRDIRPGIPHHERYKNTFGSSLAGLYGYELLSRKYPTFLVEGELDALTIAQEAGDLPINVVATGGLDCTRVPKWIGRLARMPLVLVAYDREPRGEEKAKTWLNILEHNAIRYRPLPPCKDVNDMHVQGYSVRTWVEAALQLLSEQDQDGEASPVTTIEPQSGPGRAETARAFYEAFCSRPGHNLRLREDDAICIGVPADMSDTEFEQIAHVVESFKPELRSLLSEKASEPQSGPAETQEQFSDYVNQLARGLEESTGEAWSVRLLPQGFTLEDRVQELQQEEKQSATRTPNRVKDKLPSWLVPGSYDWNKQIKHMSEPKDGTPALYTQEQAMQELQARRRAWYEQHKAS